MIYNTWCHEISHKIPEPWLTRLFKINERVKTTSWAWYFLSFTNFNCTYYVCFVWIRALPTCNSKIKSVETRHPRCVVRWSGAARNIWPTGPMWTLDTSACHFAYVILCASVSWAIYWAIHHPNNKYCSVARSVSTLMDSCKYLIICLIVRYRIISEPEEGAWKSYLTGARWPTTWMSFHRGCSRFPYFDL